MIVITTVTKNQHPAGKHTYTIRIKTQNHNYNNKTNLYYEETLLLIYPAGYINSMAHRT
jgi:hypothetical protein